MKDWPLKAAILHIGAPKTGSSFLQRWLHYNYQQLRRCEINFLPEVPSVRIAIEFFPPDIRQRADVAEIMKTDIGSALSALRFDMTNIISSEYFFHSNAAATADFLNSSGIFVTKILCFVRRQDILYASGYSQDVKSLGLSSRPPRKFSGDTLNYYRTFNEWSTAFPDSETIFLNYDRVKDCLLDAFKAHIPEANGTIDIVDRENISLNAEMTEIARMLNERGIPFDRHSLIEIQKSSPKPPFSFSPEITAVIEDCYQAANTQLANAIPKEFDDFCQPGWSPVGEDFTDKVTEERLKSIIEMMDLRKSSILL